MAVLGCSTVLGDLLVSEPDQWHRLTRSRSPVPDYDARLLDAVTDGQEVMTGPSAVQALRSGYRGLLPDEPDALQDIRGAFVERLGGTLVLNADSLIAVGSSR